MRRALLMTLLAACGDDAGGGPDAGNPNDGGLLVDAPGGCERTAAAADRPRFVVVSHPFDSQGGRSGQFEVLALSTAGELTRFSPPRAFTMGRASYGTIAFTPDGEVGLVATEMGKLAVFTLDASGTPTVVHAELGGSYYASQVVMDPRGDRAYVIEGNTRGNGGGIFLVTIGCDGTVTDQGLVAPADLPRGLAFRPNGQAVVGARNILDHETAGDDVHLLSWDGAPAHVTGADAFGDDNQIYGGAALDRNGTTYFVGDTSAVAANRVAIVGVSDTALTPLGVLALEDPQSIVASPFGDVALVTSAFGDAIKVLDKEGANGAWRIRGDAPTTGGNPQLPGDMAMITRGALTGHVFVAENVSVRHLAFQQNGTVMDLGSVPFGGGVQNILGVIGVTP